MCCMDALKEPWEPRHAATHQWWNLNLYKLNEFHKIPPTWILVEREQKTCIMFFSWARTPISTFLSLPFAMLCSFDTRLEVCVLESFVYEAVVPFVQRKGLGWILPLHETWPWRTSQKLLLSMHSCSTCTLKMWKKKEQGNIWYQARLPCMRMVL